MIVTSKIDEQKWIWVKVPKTGTRAYFELFQLPKNKVKIKYGYPVVGATPSVAAALEDDENRFLHTHYTFQVLYTLHGRKHPGFTVVRHPFNRFISALNHLIDTGTAGKMPYDTIENLTDFLLNNFDKNCMPKNDKSIEQIFDLKYTPYQNSFFQTQTYWAYHPKVQWFKYENIEYFNEWIETTLGFNTQNLKIVGKIKTNHLSHLNVHDEKFKNMIEHLFHADYKIFGYT